MVLKHYTQRTLSSNLLNLWYQLRALFLNLIGTEGGRVGPPAGYVCVFEDQFRQLDSDTWRMAQPWGNFHKDQRWWYWPQRNETPSPVVYPTPDGLALELRNYPKEFKRSELPQWRQSGLEVENWRATWAAGLISSRKSFKWGWIEAEIQLPSERAQWSAFWLAGRDQWPPEIDIFEAYTDRDVDEIQVKPNIHWGPVGVGDWRQGKKDWGAPIIPIYEPNKRFVQYACHWTQDWIRIYYDGILVSECTIPEALENNNLPQYIILNNGCKDPVVKGVNPIESAMLVRNLKVYQHPDWINWS